MKKVLLFACLLLVVSMCLALPPGKPNWVGFERTSPTTGTIRWSSEPSAGVNYYYLGLHSTETVYTAPSYCDPNWNVPGGWVGTFVEDSPGYLKKDVLALDPAKDYYAYVAAVETGGWSWAAYSSWESGPLVLPVELSSFSATLSASRFVNITWTSESESDLLGYRLYRSENQNIANALVITPLMIPATNTTISCTYSHQDNEVAVNNTYWYWLESVESVGDRLHGPVSVFVSDNNPDSPALPETTVIGNIYPNPLRIGGTASVEVSVKAGDKADINIYNARGQMIRTTSMTEGIHRLNWDGTDSKGNHCASGVYFYHIKSSSASKTLKLMLVK